MSVKKGKLRHNKISRLVRQTLSKGGSLQEVLDKFFGEKVDVDFDLDEKDIKYLKGMLAYKTDNHSRRENLVGVIVANLLLFLSVCINIIMMFPFLKFSGFMDMGLINIIILAPIYFFYPWLFIYFMFQLSSYNLKKYKWFLFFIWLTIVADLLRFLPDFNDMSFLGLIDLTLRIIIGIIVVNVYVVLKNRFNIKDIEVNDESGNRVKKRIITLNKN